MRKYPRTKEELITLYGTLRKQLLDTTTTTINAASAKASDESKMMEEQVPIPPNLPLQEKALHGTGKSPSSSGSELPDEKVRETTVKASKSYPYMPIGTTTRASFGGLVREGIVPLHKPSSSTTQVDLETNSHFGVDDPMPLESPSLEPHLATTRMELNALKGTLIQCIQNFNQARSCLEGILPIVADIKEVKDRVNQIQTTIDTESKRTKESTVACIEILSNLSKKDLPKKDIPTTTSSSSGKSSSWVQRRKKSKQES